MATPGPQPHRIRFGAFELDVADRTLRRRGRIIRLQPQHFDVLLILIDSAGLVVSREEIRERVWGADTFVDFQRSINFAINQIRAALNDDPGRPSFIQTVPKRGYRFIAEIEIDHQGFTFDSHDRPVLVHPVPIDSAQIDQEEPREMYEDRLGQVPADRSSERPLLSVATVFSCLIVVLVGLGVLCYLRQRTDIINQLPMENSTEVLAARAREIAKSLGYTEREADSTFGWNYDESFLRYAGARKSLFALRKDTGTQYSPAVFFWLRESQYYSASFSGIYAPRHFDRDSLGPGMSTPGEALR